MNRNYEDVLAVPRDLPLIGYRDGRRYFRADLLMRTWRLAWQNTYKDMPGAIFVSWNKVERGMVGHIIREWLTLPPSAIHGFLEFIVISWPNLEQESGGQIDGVAVPQLPSIRQIVKYRRQFMKMYINHLSTTQQTCKPNSR